MTDSIKHQKELVRNAHSWVPHRWDSGESQQCVLTNPPAHHTQEGTTETTARMAAAVGGPNFLLIPTWIFLAPSSGSTRPHPATIAEQRCPASDLACASSFQLQSEKRTEKTSLLNSAPTHERPGRPQTSGFNFRRRGRVWEGEWVEGSVRKGLGTDVSNFLGTGGGGGGYSFSQPPPGAN